MNLRAPRRGDFDVHSTELGAPLTVHGFLRVTFSGGSDDLERQLLYILTDGCYL